VEGQAPALVRARVVALRPLTADDALAAIGRLDASFQGIAYWIFGGWAVDFHAGRVTRDHGDIDVAVWQADLETVRDILRVDGWTHAPSSGDDGYTSYARGSLHLDLAFLALDAGGIVYTPLRDGRGEWPLHSFGDDVRELAGTRARVVSLASLFADKSQVREDVDTAAKDAADVAVLRGAGIG
jgi:lincosamide nucleotidyltransferase A/C/D/E